jgi:hypothetical protein
MKIIIWGYPLHTHTHSYIHHGYYRAFKSLGHDVYWLDSSNYRGVDFNDSLILTEHFATANLPLVKTSTYFVHYLGNKNQYESKYLNHVDRLIDLRYNADNWHDKNYDYSLDRENIEKISSGTYFEKGTNYDIVYTTWATDLLPEQINLEDRFIKRSNTVHYVGTIGGGRGGLFDCQKAPDYYDTVPHIIPFYNACLEHNIDFVSNCPWLSPISDEEMKNRIQKSYLAPDFRHDAMLDWGYIPCRVMKNISYGQLGITNSEAVYKFFNKKVIYDKNGYELFKLGVQNMNNYDLIKEQMELVRDEHTYINRANDLIKIFNNR